MQTSRVSRGECTARPAGRIFTDTIRLTEIYRQAADSGIVQARILSTAGNIRSSEVISSWCAAINQRGDHQIARHGRALPARDDAGLTPVKAF